MTDTVVDRWTLEAPDGHARRVATFVDARVFLRRLWNLAKEPVFVRRGPGVYECSPPARGYPVLFIGPWLIYNAHGLKTLRNQLQLPLPFDADPAAVSATDPDAGL